MGVELQVAPGVSLGRLDWTIHNAALLLADLTGAVDVSHSQAIQFVVGGLPPGDGFTITLAGTTDAPAGLQCSGSATFGVVAHFTSSVVLNVVCTDAIDGEGTGSIAVGGSVTVAPPCAAVKSLSASPSEVDVGSSLRLTASAADRTGSSSDAVLSWSVSGGTGAGTFSSTTSASPTFTCTRAGPVDLTVTASTTGALGCTESTASVNITCDAAQTVGGACSMPDAGLGGIGVPAGTIATASGSYGPPASAIDGLVETGWNSGDHSGWIELTFPSPVLLNGIALEVAALPETPEVYTITGFHGTAAVFLGTWTETVCNCNIALPPMLVPPGAYDAIRIDVQGEQSWVAINEISILTENCPGGDGGTFGIDAGSDLDAGPPDAIEENSADAPPPPTLACLPAGTYWIPYTATSCTFTELPACSVSVNTGSGVIGVQVVFDPMMGWVTKYLDWPGGLGAQPPPTPFLGNTLTSLGRTNLCAVTSAGSFQFVIDCVQGIVSFTGNCGATHLGACPFSSSCARFTSPGSGLAVSGSVSIFGDAGAGGD